MKNTTTATIKAMMVIPTIQDIHSPVDSVLSFIQGAVKIKTIPAPLEMMPTMEHNVKTQPGARRIRPKISWNLWRIVMTSIKRKTIDMLQKMVAAARSILLMMSETSVVGFLGRKKGARIKMNAARSAARAL